MRSADENPIPQPTLKSQRTTPPPPGSLWAIIPVKRLEHAKQRLSGVLEAAERAALTVDMLKHVLGAVSASPAQGLVVSPDPAALELAATYGAIPLAEARAGLNAALHQATRYACHRGAAAVLILPADLPLLSPQDIHTMWRRAQAGAEPCMVIAPSLREDGTNALLVSPPCLITYQFGPDSFRRHCAQARALNLRLDVYRSHRLALDVDLPDDLEYLLSLENAEQHLEEVEPMIDAQVAEFLNQRELLLRLATIGKDGYPHVTPVWYLYENGRFYLTITTERQKFHNVKANSKVGFSIDHATRPYRGIMVKGDACISEENVREVTERIAARYVPPERLAGMVEWLLGFPRVLLIIEPKQVVRFGDWSQ